MFFKNNANNQKVIILVADSAGIGEAPDAEEIDKGCNTIGNVREYRRKHGQCANLSNLETMGLDKLLGEDAGQTATAHFAKAQIKSKMNGTDTGHWEIIGVVTGKYPASRDPLKKEMIEYLEQRISHELKYRHCLKYGW